MTDQRARIRTAVGDGGLKKSVLAKEAGLSPEVLTGVDLDDWNPRIETLNALCAALDRIAARLAA